MSRVPRLTIVAVLLAAVAGLGSTTQTEGSPVVPSHDEPTEAEYAFYDTELPCPGFQGLELSNRTVSVIGGTVTLRCDYRTEDGRPQSVGIEWLKTDFDGYASFTCERSDERIDDGRTIRDLVRPDPPAAAFGTYSLDTLAEREGEFVAAVESLLAAASPLARNCVPPPDPLDCPQIPGHALNTAGEPNEIQPDTYAQTCTYEASAAGGDDRLTVAVWWAARGGVPFLIDRLCNEPEWEGVGFGVVVTKGIAANGTYWRHSPLEGPDVAVARAAAQSLLDQAAAVAADCTGAEVFPAEWQPFPDYLAEQFGAGLTEPFDPGAGPPADSGGDAPGPVPVAEDGGLVETLLRIGSVVMLVVSALGLFIAFLLVRRETRIRERRDLLRIGITLAVAVASVLILGRHAPLWAVLVAVGLGLGLGTWQGSNLMVRSTERGLLAQRSLLAVIAFGAGVLLMQVAGLLNRTGAVTIGVAASFLSAAIAAGLFVGRRPRMAEAIAGASRLVLPTAVLGSLLVGLGVATVGAQTGETPPGTCGRAGLVIDLSDCPGYQHLLDVVPWDKAFVTGGLWWDQGKPPAPLALPRALATPPEPVQQTVSWTVAVPDSSTSVDYQVDETYSFGTLAEGACCSVSYTATGTSTTHREGQDPVVEAYEVSGRVDDVHPLGTIPLSNAPLGVPFTEGLTLRGAPEDSCQRAVAWRQDDNEEGAATWDVLTVNGEEGRGFASTEVTVFIGCDLPDFTYENAFALAPPPPASDDPARTIRRTTGVEVCPVRQEFVGYVWQAGKFEGVETLTLADLFLEPNAVACDYGALPGFGRALSFGEGGRGNTRHELLYRLTIQSDPAAEAIRLADDEDTFFSQARPTSVPDYERCELGADGVPLPPPEGQDCRYITIHSPGAVSALSSLQAGRSSLNVHGGQVIIETEYVPDGPNVWVRAHLPGWGKYVYRCHHCTPGDPRITEFIASLHDFGRERGMGVPGGDGTPPPDAEGDATPPEEGDIVFEPAATDDDLTPEQIALIGLVGVLGSIGLLGTALEGTGLTAADILEAIRRGDVTGGVAQPPPLLDEDGEPLLVNDGSYPDVPEGWVWWGTEGDEGRWVPPEEAEVLVADTRAAGEALQRERAEALEEAMRRAGEDWEELIRGTRAEAAEAALERAMSEEERQVLAEGTQEAWEAALAAGHDDLVDFIDRQDSLTADQIQAIFDAINRRGADEDALAAIPEVNVWRETIEGTLDDMADMAEAAGQPGVAWILRNPGVSARVGAAVVTGGWSEVVAVPMDIVQRLDAAQQRSLEENGRMMTSEELFGELGWALGTEAVYEVGGRVVASGLGAVFSSSDELAEAVLRQGDEATGAGARQLDEGAEALLRQGDEAMEAGARQLDEAMGVPPKGNEALAGLETGARIPDELVPQTGLPRSQLDALQDYTRQNDLNVTGRSTNPYSREALESGAAVPKPLDIKIKTGNDLDVMLGANPANRGQVTLFEPRMPDTSGMSPELAQALEQRYASRMSEWNKYRSTWQEGTEQVMTVKGVDRTHRVVDGRIEVLYDGQWRSYAGDFDLVDITRADGAPLSAAEFNAHVEAMVDRGLVEHGGEVRIMTDVMRNSPHPVGSDAWMEQAREVWAVRESLENAHLAGSEIIIGVHATEGLHRGPVLDEFLPWRGGFEASGGGLIP